MADTRHDPVLTAQIAAMLLQGRSDAEPHHVEAAVTTAKVVIDKAAGHPTEAEEAATAQAEAEAEAQAKADKDAAKAEAKAEAEKAPE